MNILQALDDPNLFGAAIRDPSTFRASRAFLAAMFGVPMTEAEQETYRVCTGRGDSPSGGFREGWLVCGRRGGKSRALAFAAVYIAAFRDVREHLAPGERATVQVIAADRRQARAVFNYLRGIVAASPMLARLVERETADSIDLSTSVSIEVTTASFRSVRGYTVAAALADELAFWMDDGSANPAAEIIDAIRPAMATIPGAMLLAASSPHARKGILYETFRDHFGKDGDPILVWSAPTWAMNPTLPQARFAAAFAADPVKAASEYGAVFRTDIENYVSLDVLNRLVPAGVVERAPHPGVAYHAFVDPSGGQSDSMTLAIAHHVGARTVLDAVRERKAPFSPDDVVAEFASLLGRYSLATVAGDRYAAQWPVEAFRRYGINLMPADNAKSALYVNLLPRLNSSEVDLLDIPVLVSQLAALERRPTRGGRETIDHPPNGHDDVANAVAGALAGNRALASVAAFGRYTMTKYATDAGNLVKYGAPPDWYKRGDRFPPGDPRWKLEKT